MNVNLKVVYTPQTLPVGHKTPEIVKIHSFKFKPFSFNSNIDNWNNACDEETKE